MEATLQALGGLLVKAIPTLLLVILLHFYLKKVFFGPLVRVLEQRRLATEGARRQAEELLARAAARTAEYEEALRNARSEIYQELEISRRRWREQHAEAVQQARERAQALIGEARRQLEAELAMARAGLQVRAEQLASRIAEALLGGRAA